MRDAKWVEGELQVCFLKHVWAFLVRVSVARWEETHEKVRKGEQERERKTVEDKRIWKQRECRNQKGVSKNDSSIHMSNLESIHLLKTTWRWLGLFNMTGSINRGCQKKKEGDRKQWYSRREEWGGKTAGGKDGEVCCQFYFGLRSSTILFSRGGNAHTHTHTQTHTHTHTRAHWSIVLADCLILHFSSGRC